MFSSFFNGLILFTVVRLKEDPFGRFVCFPNSILQATRQIIRRKSYQHNNNDWISKGQQSIATRMRM